MRKIIRYIINRLCDYYPYEVIDRLIKDNHYSTYIELGVWKGETLFNIAKLNPLVYCIGIDEYSASNYKEYKHGETMSKISTEVFFCIKNNVLLKAEDFNNIEIFTYSSKSALKYIKDESIDIIFIDAKHDYKSVVEDIKTWVLKIRKGGILCGHDFDFRHFSVVKAVDKVIGVDNIEVDKNTGVWIYRK